MRILIVDDDNALAVAVKRVLIEHGHEVTCADSADSALEIVAKEPFDFVFVDYKMPVHDGVWFLKNAKLPRKTKVLLSTAYGHRDVINQMFKLGAAGYLIKPYNADDIIRNIAFHSSKRDIS